MERSFSIKDIITETSFSELIVDDKFFIMLSLTKTGQHLLQRCLALEWIYIISLLGKLIDRHQ